MNAVSSILTEIRFSAYPISFMDEALAVWYNTLIEERALHTHERRSSMADGFDILRKLIAQENGRIKEMRTIKDIEDLLEKLTKIQDSFRNQKTPHEVKVKNELDYLIRRIISMATVVYQRELQQMQEDSP